MTELMRLLYEYTEENRLPRYLDQAAFQRNKQMLVKSVDALHQSMTREQIQVLQDTEDLRWERQDMELEAMFLAAFSLARELPSSFGA